MDIRQGSYQQRRGQIEDYFDRTAVRAWEQLTSTAPVGRIRATVRAGRDRMRATLLDWLPASMQGLRLLDAGCGTAALAVEAARRGAEVVAIDLSPQLVDVARQRIAELEDGAQLLARIELRSGDMLDPALGHFDHIVAMDSLIHYSMDDALRLLQAWAPRTRESMAFTFAPRNPMLVAMRSVGSLFPRSNRAPWIEPMAESELRRRIDAALRDAGWQAQRTQRVSSGFYTSQALRLVRAC
ncbi:MAG: magnesium protoporphyrin IX methyltransferase [Rubrivivax sp.]